MRWVCRGNMLFNLALMTSRTRIIIANFQCYDALWLFDMPVYLEIRDCIVSNDLSGQISQGSFGAQSGFLG